MVALDDSFAHLRISKSEDAEEKRAKEEKKSKNVKESRKRVKLRKRRSEKRKERKKSNKLQWNQIFTQRSASTN